MRPPRRSIDFSDSAVDLPNLVWYLDEPVADLSAVGFLALSRLATQHVTVALSGHKARTNSSGATASTGSSGLRRLRHSPSRRPTTARATPSGLRRIALLGCHPFSRPTTLSRGSSRWERAPRRRDRARLYSGPLAGADASCRTVPSPRRARGDTLLTSMFLDGQLALPELQHAPLFRPDVAWAASLEVRVRVPRPRSGGVGVPAAQPRPRVDGALTTKGSCFDVRQRGTCRQT